MSNDGFMLTISEAEALVTAALTRSNVSPDVAAGVARALVAAEVDGQPGHGFSRVAAYAAQARSGKVVGAAEPALDWSGVAFARVDAGHGFAYPAIELAIDALATRAPETGIAGAAIYRSHHCGQLGAHVERLAERGLVGLMVANAPKAIAPWGGSAPLLGTNPIAFAAPIEGEAPLVIDLSMSKVARGKVMAAAKAGEPIPEGWAFDVDGRPTTDPNAALAGTMAPLGDAKGAALALMVEVLAATMIGANHSYEAASFFDAEGAPPSVGQMIIAFAPEKTSGAAGFDQRMAQLAAALTAQEGARLPGGKRLAARDKAKREGVKISSKLREEIESIASA